MRALLGEGLDLARTHADGQRAIGFAGRHLRAQERGTVLALEGDEMAAGVKHRDAQRLELEIGALGEGGIDDLPGFFERQCGHGNLLLERDNHRRPAGRSNPVFG